VLPGIQDFREFADLGALHGYFGVSSEVGLRDLAGFIEAPSELDGDSGPVDSTPRDSPKASHELGESDRQRLLTIHGELLETLLSYRESFGTRLSVADRQTKFLLAHLLTPGSARFFMGLGAIAATNLGLMIGMLVEPVLLLARRHGGSEGPAPVQDLITLVVFSFRDLHRSLSASFPIMAGLDWAWIVVGLTFMLAAVVIHASLGRSIDSLTEFVVPGKESLPGLGARSAKAEVRGERGPMAAREGSRDGRYRRLAVLVLMLLGIATLLSTGRSEYTVLATVVGSTVALGLVGVSTLATQIFLARATADPPHPRPAALPMLLVAVPLVVPIAMVIAFVSTAGSSRDASIEATAYGAAVLVLHVGCVLFSAGHAAGQAFRNYEYWRARVVWLEEWIRSVRRRIEEPSADREIPDPAPIEPSAIGLRQDMSIRSAYLQGHHLGSIARSSKTEVREGIPVG